MNKVFNGSYREALLGASSFLSDRGCEEAIAYHYLLGLMDWEPNDWYRYQFQSMSVEDYAAYEAGIQRIAKDHYPYQYLLGEAYFYRYKFKVTPATLIPRQETELLVDRVKDLLAKGELPRQAQVVDIGTGTGAIALTLKKECPDLQITATDLSEEALAVARDNAQALQADIQLAQGDLYQAIQGQTFDLIVSNPPYIGRQEIDEVAEDVQRYEPDLALFAEEEGYAIYYRLIDDLDAYLRPGGSFIAEIGYRQGDQLLAYCQTHLPHNYHYRIEEDFAGHDRFLVVSKEGEREDDGNLSE
ncbi:peptide chain release factor N(5)-glutamine methyltransferase [Aerococcus sanguinicola]|uniref:peptide chain release factor N(5)-glutamine methyltransferase n=1 Tax=unclassified Aerococcus TaxID=2618060 RepID=UPI0008A622DF|nr:MULTISPECIES: peptide chain release factor N(5)-glutamine methyltransferase [unclassified Aerococcus]KAB0645976.1 peptide chain release factor N(5)-glutamine methyltransferase [Aerococcus sanguinicola]MDK6234259.1 peptide chain release factor N(5)-glutamine methyltransferase [Aerococcus sp. UMB10185]MDK6855390.1 peptide chain release factor N(5)-glutamine methyltransferase [Aerococcus sp. UMB7533]MDK8501567.1 peptide chain release factor N(5)-glutamine methyltransferase [Aerococcus sp. UMB11